MYPDLMIAGLEEERDMLLSLGMIKFSTSFKEEHKTRDLEVCWKIVHISNSFEPSLFIALQLFVDHNKLKKLTENLQDIHALKISDHGSSIFNHI